MLVTGVQAAGSKGLSAVQGAVVDIKDAARTGVAGGRDGDRANAAEKQGDPQPVVFPRKGVPMDQRPVGLRQQQATARYRAYGGGGDRDHDGDAA